MTNNRVKYNRILLKLSGESFKSESKFIDPEAIEYVSSQIKKVHDLGIELGVVVGGGNILRGSEAEAAGMRSTGIGCFFDDALHQVVGLAGCRYQDLYHFTVGRQVDDPRLKTRPAYTLRQRSSPTRALR